MADISTLVDDINNWLISKDRSVTDEEANELGQELASIIKEKLNVVRNGTYLRLSNLGSECDKELHYKVNHPELEEPLPPEAHMKFLFGDILEVLLLFLAKKTGHKVEGRQDKMDLYGVPGSRDAVIDGCLVDAKSASSRSFAKFADGTLEKDDPFGYITQLNGYLESSKDDPLVVEKDKAYFFVVDKTLGHICLLPIKKRDVNWKQYVENARKMLAGKSPVRRYMPEPDGKSGNMKLGTKCGYCAFKGDCWPNARVFLYSSGPRFLTRVVREPDVPEVIKEKPKNGS